MRRRKATRFTAIAAGDQNLSVYPALAENRFDVVLTATRPGTFEVETSGGNRLVMTRVAGILDPTRVAVRAAGDGWVVKVSRRAVDQIGLVPGAEAWLLNKSHAIVAGG